jgi:hypothetical protein
MGIRTAVCGLLVGAVLGGLSSVVEAGAQEVSLEVRTKEGRAEYRVGESIALQLVFVSSSKQVIVDSSFRFPDFQKPQDEFLVEPKDGADDPMEDYRRALSTNRFSCCADGGLRGFGRLGGEPVVVDLELNQYLRFTKPGRYELTVRDRRAHSVDRSSQEAPEAIELVSKPLPLTILTSDPVWERQQLNSALEALRKGPGVNMEACRAVAALGTPAAEVAMAESLEDETPGCNFSSFLLGAKDRKLVLSWMQQDLESPQARINQVFLETLATLTALEEDGNADFLQRQSDARKHVSDELFDLLDEKKGAARIAAVSTLVNASLQATGSENSAHEAQVLRLAAEVFEQLSQQAQSTLLSARWTEVASPAMVPVLRRCAEADNSTSCGLVQGDLLLTRLNELSPTEAREVALADIQKNNPRFSSQVLAMLPDKELPDLDGVLREHLVTEGGNVDTAAGLIQRYATGGIVGAVLSYLDEHEPGKLGGEIEQNLIAYLFRILPDAGEQKLRAALAAREGTSMYKYMLHEVAQRTSSPRIQQIAIEALSDQDYEVVQSAAQALGQVGDEHAKAALLERLAAWQGKWTGREREFFWTLDSGPIRDDRYLGDELIRTIATGTGWLLTEKDQQQLLASALTDNQKQQVNQFIEATKNRPIAITIINTLPPNNQFIVAQYNYESLELLKRKLSQFPAQTNFQLQSIPPESAEMRRAVAEIESFLGQNGMRVEIAKAQ